MVAAALMTSAEQKTAPVMTTTTTTKTKTHVDDASVVKVEEQRKIERLAKEEAGMEETMRRNEIASTSLIVENQQQKRKAGELPIETKFGNPSTFCERGEDATTMTTATQQQQQLVLLQQNSTRMAFANQKGLLSRKFYSTNPMSMF